MIAFLSGKYVAKTPANLWLDVNGVGYEVHISLHTYSRIQDEDGGRLLTYLQVKEDSLTLFGFFDEEERNLFIQLLSVGGIGAGTARMMLSSMKPHEIRQAILTDNELLLGRIKGIGPKTAKRIILELKDKIMKSKPAENIQAGNDNNTEQDALTALVSLGIARTAAYTAIQKVMKTEQEIKLEELIKRSLQNL